MDAHAAPPRDQPPATPGVKVVTRPVRQPLGNRAWVLIAGGVFLVMAVVTVVIGVRFARTAYALFQEQDKAVAVAQAYVAAGIAGDWATAHGHLATDLRATTTPEALRDAWARRERANGRVTGLAVTDRTVSAINGRRYARVVGALGYTGAAPEILRLYFVSEGGAWKLERLP